MWAFAEGLEVIFIVVLLYLIWPIAFNVAGRLATIRTSAKARRPTKSEHERIKGVRRQRSKQSGPGSNDVVLLGIGAVTWYITAKRRKTYCLMMRIASKESQ